MSGRRGRNQARRKGGNGMPGWAWLAIGLVLGAAALWGGASLMDRDHDFLKPQPNPDATPPAASSEEPVASADPGTRFDFYTLLPGDGVAMSDEELAASARAEAAAEAAVRSRAEPADEVDGFNLSNDPAASTPPAPASTADAGAGAHDDGARYVLQAGAFRSAGDAETVKAKIAMLGLAARVEPAEIADGSMVYRVRMGPYESAATLADAKRKLADGGLPSLAIRAR